MWLNLEAKVQKRIVISSKHGLGLLELADAGQMNWQYKWLSTKVEIKSFYSITNNGYLDTENKILKK